MSALPALIRVTAEHIQLGEPWMCDACPVALALADALHGAQVEFYRLEVQLDYITVMAREAGREWEAETPPDVRRWIDRFDDGDAGDWPFEFELEWSGES